jgi:hypothetical protein
MSATITLKLSPLKKRRAISEDDAEEVGGEIVAIITAFLEQKLTRKAEAKMLEDIDIDSGTLAEFDYAALQKTRLTFRFHSHWQGGAEAAEHWYYLALMRCKEAINTQLKVVDFHIEDQEFATLQREIKTRPLVTSNGTMFALDKGGAPMLVEGESITGSEGERILWRELASANTCQCQLCL